MIKAKVISSMGQAAFERDLIKWFFENDVKIISVSHSVLEGDMPSGQPGIMAKMFSLTALIIYEE